MAPDIQPISGPEWAPLPYEGCVGVEVKRLLRLPHLSIAMLRFTPGGMIHEHPAPMDIDVVCLEGQGFTSVDGVAAPFVAGQRVRWPREVSHKLWTEDQPMITLMVEHRRDD